MSYKQKQIIEGNVNNGNFGSAVSIDENYIVIGASGERRISIYRKNYNGIWEQIFTYILGIGDFGYSTNISGNYCFVVAPTTFILRGVVYVMERTEVAETETWAFATVFTSSDHAVGDRFGHSISCSGSCLAVGSPDKNTATGAVYIYERTTVAVWPETKKIILGDGESGDSFGYSVSMNKDWLVVGASGRNNNTGAAYLYYKNKGASEEWIYIDKIIASDRNENDYFGSSVSICGNYLVVGAPYHDNEELNSGTVYLFKLSGSNWREIKKITGSAEILGNRNNYFGSSVNISEEMLIVGAPGARHNQGIVDIFSKKKDWAHLKKIVASDGVVSSGDNFGNSVGVSGPYIAIGSYLKSFE